MSNDNIVRIGVVGYSGQSFDETKAAEHLTDAFDHITKVYEGGATGFRVVSGLTAIGVPRLAYKEADARGWETWGVACAKAVEYDCWPVDHSVIVGDEWGDESDRFLAECDVLVRVGGGAQSHAEAEKFDGPLYEYDLPAS